MQSKDEKKPLIDKSAQPTVLGVDVATLPTADGTIVPLLSYGQAAWQVSSFSFPFILSRVAVAVNVLSNGYITPKVGPDAAAAGPSMISILYSVLGPCRSMLLATGILVGKKNGEVKSLLELGRVEEATLIQKEIGLQLKQSFIFASMLGGASIAFMLAMGPVLKAIGMNATVADQVQDYLDASSTGILPIYWSTGDQQFALGTGHKYIPMCFGSLFAVLAMLFSYPLALGSFGLPKLGTSGLGYGMSAAAWISFIGLRAYFLKQDFAPYEIYDRHLKGVFKNFTELLKLGFPLGFQALTEWGNLFALSLLVGNKGADALMSANGSFQIITAMTLFSAALGQGISIKISEALGRMRIAYAENNIQAYLNLNTNLRRMGNMGMLVGTLATACITSVFVSIPKPIQSLFVSKEDSDYEAVMAMAKAMFITNAVGLIFDTMRNLFASALGGSKDVLFAPLVSLILMSAVGLTWGGLMTEHWDLDANWMFITRDVVIVLSAALIGWRWFKKDHTEIITNEAKPVSDEEAAIEGSRSPGIAKSMFSFFCCDKKPHATALVKSINQQENERDTHTP